MYTNQQNTVGILQSTKDLPQPPSPLFSDKHEGINAIAVTYFTILSWHIKVCCQVDPQLLLLLKQYETKFEHSIAVSVKKPLTCAHTPLI